jgi:SAM-dependent methyltransferase
LVPQAFLLPFSERIWTGPRSRLVLQTLVYTLIVGAIAYAAIERPWPWLYDNGPMIGAAAIGLVTVFCIGFRPAYLIGLAAMVLVFGGWDAIQQSLKPGARMRSYFGVYTVRDDRDTRWLAHGTTQHGLQVTSKGNERELTTYYSAFSGVGQALLRLPAILGPEARVGAVGLGTGTLACYTRTGQSWRFYEIDPLMIRIARDSGKFTFLKRCNPQVPIVLGDARLSLAREPANAFDFLVLDAFSSDAIPMHLLTREAFALYGRVVQPRGLLLVHISNRYLDLEPVVAQAAREGGWHAARYDDRVPPDSEFSRYVSSSNWIVMTRDPEVLRRVTVNPPPEGKWRPLRQEPGFAGWSDDYGSILPLLKAFR